MAKASDNAYPSILFEDHADPAAPSSGYHRLFIDTDEKLKMIDHASLVTDFTPSAGGAASGCMAQNTGSVSINADPFIIPWTAADLFDPDGYHDPGSNPSRLTVPAGKGSRLFVVTLNLEHNNNGGTARLRLDGTTVLGFWNQVSAYFHQISTMLYLTEGQYVEALIADSNGSNCIVSDYPMQFGIAPVG